MAVALTIVALAAGLILGRWWERVHRNPCPRCLIEDERQRALQDIHDIERATAAQLMKTAWSSRQLPGVQHAPRFYGEE